MAKKKTFRCLVWLRRLEKRPTAGSQIAQNNEKHNSQYSFRSVSHSSIPTHLSLLNVRIMVHQYYPSSLPRGRCALIPSPILRTKESQGPWNRVYYGLAPDSKRNNMAPSWKSTCVLANWRFDQKYEFLRGKTAGYLETNTLFLLGESFPVSTYTGERARAWFENARVHPSGKWLGFVLKFTRWGESF